MPKAKQFTLTHENRALAHVAKILCDAKVNILACLTTASGNEGLTRLIVDRADKAKKALATAGLGYTEMDMHFRTYQASHEDLIQEK
jgi:hypothetical protein